jgi:hypothetical protein
MRLNKDGARLSKPALDLGIRHRGEPYCRQAPRRDALECRTPALSLGRGIAPTAPARRRTPCLRGTGASCALLPALPRLLRRRADHPQTPANRTSPAPDSNRRPLPYHGATGVDGGSSASLGSV